MAHPYLNPAHPHYRARTATPSTSISQLSLDMMSKPTSAHELLPSEPHLGPGSAHTIALQSFTASTIDPEIVIHSSGPERRRKRSAPGTTRSANKKKSRDGSQAGQSVSERAASSVDEPLVPTRSYHFKSFEAFDSSAASVGAVPSGESYTFAPSSASPQSAEPTTTNEAGPSSPQLVPQPKKSKSILSAGKRVMKEVLGGGGDKGPPTDGKAVYYGRGGAGGASTRSGKPSATAAVTVNPPSANIAPSTRVSSSQPSVSHRSASHYTSSSAYTPSLLSSPYAESVASSPYATSVDDNSYYDSSSHSNRHTPSSLRPSTNPSPSHYALSPSSLPPELRRKSSAASSHSGGGSQPGSNRLSPPSNFQKQLWQNPWVDGTYPVTGTSHQNDLPQATQNTASHTLGPIESAVISSMGMGSAPQPSYAPSARSSMRRPSQTFNGSADISSRGLPLPNPPPNQMAQIPVVASNNASVDNPTSANDDFLAQLLGLVGVKANNSTSTQPFGALEVPNADFMPLRSIPEQPQRGLPDSLAKAVGHLSLFPNQLDSRWPRPPGPAQSMNTPRNPGYGFQSFGTVPPSMPLQNASTPTWSHGGGTTMHDLPRSQSFTSDPTGSTQILDDLCAQAYVAQQQLAQRLAEIAAWERQQQSQLQETSPSTFPPTS